MTTIIHINQYNTEKQNFEKNIRDVYKKMPDVSGLVTTTISEVKNELKKTKALIMFLVGDQRTYILLIISHYVLVYFIA